MQRTAGLTVLELLVALAAFAVVLAISVPSYGRMLARWRLDAAARQVVMDLKLARTRAVTESAAQRLRFAVPGRAYARERQQPGGAYVPAGDPVALPDGVQIAACTAVGAAVTFRPRGHAATFGSITLRNGDGAQRQVVVDMAGRLRVQ